MIQLEDFPKNYNQLTDGARWRAFERVTGAAQEALKDVVEWAGRNYGMGYQDELERQAAGIGVLLSHVFDYYGTPAALTAAHWMEDSNWHTESMVVFNLYRETLHSQQYAMAGREHERQLREHSQAEFEYKQWKSDQGL